MSDTNRVAKFESQPESQKTQGKQSDIIAHGYLVMNSRQAAKSPRPVVQLKLRSQNFDFASWRLCAILVMDSRQAAKSPSPVVQLKLRSQNFDFASWRLCAILVMDSRQDAKSPRPVVQLKLRSQNFNFASWRLCAILNNRAQFCPFK